jgi:hypothetical protein
VTSSRVPITVDAGPPPAPAVELVLDPASGPYTSGSPVAFSFDFTAYVPIDCYLIGP